MTVSSAVNRTVVSGNGSATTFAYTFKITSSSHLVVIRSTAAGVDTTLTLGTDYSVSGVGSESGGSITYPLSGSALPAGDRLIMLRSVPLTQLTDLTNQGAFYAEVHESEYDLLCMADQQLSERLDRAVTVPPSDTTALVLPNAVTRAGKYLTFDGSGNATTSATAEVSGSLMAMETTGNGSSTVWTLPAAVAGGSRSLIVSVDGVVQPISSYTVASDQLTFGQAPPLNSAVDVRIIGAPVVVSLADSTQVTATGGTTARTLAAHFANILNVKDFGAVGDGVTSDQTAIAAAVTAVLASGAILFWPPGTYLITGSVTNFHVVRHSGPGRVKLGTDTFSITPTSTQTNTIYVSPTGSNANIGFAATHPMLTIQRAIQILRDFGPYLSGTWKISLAAGSYATAGFYGGTRSQNAIVIEGPTQVGPRDVPTAEIMKSLSGTATVGLYGGPHLRVTVRNLKVSGYSATDESGLEFARFCTLIFENVHVDNCYHGIHVLDFSVYAIKGGILSNCFFGVLELFGNVRDFKYAGSIANSTYIQTCTVGIKAKELCTGHVDWATITDCTYGIEFARCCTGNLSNCVIQRNDIGIVCIAASSFVDLSTDWGVGTANKNTIKYLTLGGSSEVGRQGGENLLTAPYRGFVERKVAFNYTSTPHTGTLTKTYVVTPGYTTVAGDFQAKGSHIRLIIWGSTAANAATATLSMEISTSSAAAVNLPAAAVNFFAEFWIAVSVDGDTQSSWGRVTTSAAASPTLISAVNRTFAFSTAALAVRVGVTLGNVADTVTIVGAEIYTTDA